MISLTELQLAVMRVLWERGEATVVEVREALAGGGRGLAQTTVATLLSRLERRGAVTYRAEGRQYVYRPLVTEAGVRESAVAEVTEQWFEGDVANLVHHLLMASEVGAEDLARVRKLIETRERELERGS